MHIRRTIDSSGQVISPSQRPLADNTILATDRIPCPGGIRTQNLSRRAAADLGLRPLGHWERQELLVILL